MLNPEVSDIFLGEPVQYFFEHTVNLYKIQEGRVVNSRLRMLE